MDWNLQFETRVKGGMPVTVCCVFSPLSSEEYSDVEDLWLEVRGRRAKWIEKALTDAEWERLYAEAFENGHQRDGRRYLSRPRFYVLFARRATATAIF